MSEELTNPLRDLISDDVYQKIKHLLSDNAVRNYAIRRRYKELRANKMRAGDAIDMIREDYPYLQWDTIRKIIVTSHKG